MISMIPAGRLEFFLDTFSGRQSPALKEIGQKARLENAPIIRPQMRNFINTLLSLKKPANILEIGTAVGYSGMVFLENISKEGAFFTTIEKNERWAQIAQEHFVKYGFSDRSKIITGDAHDILKDLEGPYDFIFLDAAKGQYLSFLKDIKRVLEGGGILLSDNIFMGGDILESRFAVKRRDRTIHKRMRQYLRAVFDDGDFSSSLLPIGDGALLSVKSV